MPDPTPLPSENTQPTKPEIFHQMQQLALNPVLKGLNYETLSGVNMISTFDYTPHLMHDIRVSVPSSDNTFNPEFEQSMATVNREVAITRQFISPPGDEQYISATIQIGGISIKVNRIVGSDTTFDMTTIGNRYNTMDKTVVMTSQRMEYNDGADKEFLERMLNGFVTRINKEYGVELSPDLAAISDWLRVNFCHYPEGFSPQRMFDELIEQHQGN